MNIFPTILEPTLEEIKKKVALTDPHFKEIQIDVCDGILVDSKTYDDILEIDSIPTQSTLEIDLMTIEPCHYVYPNLNRINKFYAHIEAGKNEVCKFINECKNCGYEYGLSINSDTPLEDLEPYMNKIKYIQFLGVIPGGQGRPFIDSVLGQIKAFKQKYPRVIVQVDGGVKLDLIEKLLNAGVNNAVMGSAIFASKNIEQTISAIKSYNS